MVYFLVAIMIAVFFSSFGASSFDDSLYDFHPWNYKDKEYYEDDDEKQYPHDFPTRKFDNDEFVASVNQYDDSGRVTKTTKTLSQGAVVVLDYDSFGNLVKQTKTGP